MEYEINNPSDMTEDELMHHGVRGMRWGVRRYQNKDGTLTAKGKKRYNEELAKVREKEKTAKNKAAVQARLDRLSARKTAADEKNKELDAKTKKFFGKGKGKDKGETEEKTDGENYSSSSNKKKKVSDMSDAELAKEIQRIRLEKEYASLTTPEKVAKGDSFAKQFRKEAIAPAVKEAGKQLIRDKLLDVGKKKLGLGDKDADDGMAELDKQMKELKVKDLRLKVEKAAAEAARETSETRAAKEHTVTVDRAKKEIATKSASSIPKPAAKPETTKPTTSDTSSESRNAAYLSGMKTISAGRKQASSTISSDSHFYNPGNIESGKAHVSTTWSYGDKIEEWEA